MYNVSNANILCMYKYSNVNFNHKFNSPRLPPHYLGRRSLPLPLHPHLPGKVLFGLVADRIISPFRLGFSQQKSAKEQRKDKSVNAQ